MYVRYIIRKQLKVKRSLYQILQVLSLTFREMPIAQVLTDTSFAEVDGGTATSWNCLLNIGTAVSTCMFLVYNGVTYYNDVQYAHWFDSTRPVHLFQAVRPAAGRFASIRSMGRWRCKQRDDVSYRSRVLMRSTVLEHCDGCFDCTGRIGYIGDGRYIEVAVIINDNGRLGSPRDGVERDPELAIVGGRRKVPQQWMMIVRATIASG